MPLSLQKDPILIAVYDVRPSILQANSPFSVDEMVSAYLPESVAL